MIWDHIDNLDDDEQDVAWEHLMDSQCEGSLDGKKFFYGAGCHECINIVEWINSRKVSRILQGKRLMGVKKI